jgi:hypothetical protein
VQIFKDKQHWVLSRKAGELPLSASKVSSFLRRGSTRSLDSRRSATSTTRRRGNIRFATSRFRRGFSHQSNLRSFTSGYPSIGICRTLKLIDDQRALCW